MCKLKKLSNDKKRPGGEEDEQQGEGEEGAEPVEEEGPAWAEGGGKTAAAAAAAGAAASAKGKGKGKAAPPAGLVPVSRPKPNPKAGKLAAMVPNKKKADAKKYKLLKAAQRAARRAGAKGAAVPADLVDLGNPGPDVAAAYVKKKAEPSIVRAAKKVCVCAGCLTPRDFRPRYPSAFMLTCCKCVGAPGGEGEAADGGQG